MSLKTLLSKYLPAYYIGVATAAARDGDNFIVGTGIPATEVGVATKTLLNGTKLEIDVYGHDRQGPAVPVVLDHDTFIFDFDIGTQVGNPARHENQLTFSFYASKGLDKLSERILIDTDPDAGEATYDTFYYKPDPVNGGADLYNNPKFLGAPIVSDDEGNANVTQQSTNLAFGLFDGIEKYEIGDVIDEMSTVEKLRYFTALATPWNAASKQVIANVNADLDEMNANDPFDFATDGGEFDILFQFVNRLGGVELQNHVVLEII